MYSIAPGRSSSGCMSLMYWTYHSFFRVAIASRSDSETSSPPISSRISSDRVRLTPLSRSLSASEKSKPSSRASRFQAR